MTAVKLFQLAWTLVAFAALLFQVWVILDVHRDHGSIDNPGSRLTWWREILRAYGLWWVQVVMVFAGLYAFLGPQPIAERTVGAQVFAAGFISVELVLFCISAMSVYARRRVRELERLDVLRELLQDAEPMSG